MRTTSIVPVLLAVSLFACFLPPASLAQGMTPAFGPQQYTRTTAAPQTFTDTFEHCGSAACKIVVLNGNPDGTGRISSAMIFLNGVPVVGPNDFNQNVGMIMKPVMLADTNQLTVKLASKPGGFLTITVECVASLANLTLGVPGVDLFDPMTLLTAVPIANMGMAAAENVELSNIMLSDGTLSVPAMLPFGLGTIPAGSSTVLNATFTGAFMPLGAHLLELEGTYTEGAATFCFELSTTLRIPPASPGEALLTAVMVPSDTVDGAPFPPQDPEPGGPVNNQQWTVPTAPFVPGDPPPGSTSVLPAPMSMALGGGELGTLDAGPIVFNVNNSIGITANVSGTAEPSGASGGGVVFVSANFIGAFSTDGGNVFTPLNPTTIFPADAIGFCCDQIVQYIPSIDRFAWLLQGGGLSGYRLAVASPAQIIASNGTAWTYWNLPAGLFGSCSGFDYPDMSLGNSFLYMSWDAGFGGCSGGLQVARTSFAGLQAGGTITIEFTDPANGPMAWGSHIMHDSGDEVFWAGHNNNSNLRVFSLREDSNTYFWRSVGISSWANNAPLTSLTPDNMNWINFLFNPTTQNPGGGFPSNAVLGATRVGNALWFAWSAGTNSSFPQAHIEIVTLDRSDDFDKIQQVQVWNPDYAFAYPALSRNVCTNEIGMSFEFGGGGNYENHVVGFWGDFIAYITTSSNVGSTRFGDYVTIRQAPFTPEDPGNLFTAFGYGRNTATPPATGTVSDVHYVLFGRPSSSCIIIE